MIPRPVIVFVTDRHRFRLSTPDLLDRIAIAAEAGVDLIQLRERDLTDRELLDLAHRAIAVVRDHRTRILVNERLDIAVAAGAAGVHLRGDSAPAARVRAAAPQRFIIGRSVHRIAEAELVDRGGGCDYLLFGTVFPSGGKPAGHETSGTAALAEACRRVRVPVIAIGGIGASNVHAVAAAGAHGVAAVAPFMELRDRASAKALVTALRRGFDSDRPVVYSDRTP